MHVSGERLPFTLYTSSFLYICLNKKKIHNAELEKRELFQDLAPLLWNSFGTIAALLQEIVSIYPVLSPPNLTPAQSNRVCNALALLQCVASHPDTRMLFLNAHIPLYLYPFLNTTSKSRPFEYLRLTSLGVIGALVKVDDTEVISFLLSTEIIPLCLRTMEMGSELSKTVECCYFTSFCFSKYVKKLVLILFTFTISAIVWMLVWKTTDPLETDGDNVFQFSEFNVLKILSYIIELLHRIPSSEMFSILKRYNALFLVSFVPLDSFGCDAAPCNNPEVATFIVQKILLDDVGLDYICTTAERFFAVGRVLGNMVAALADQPSSRACDALRSCLPDMLRDATFSSCLREDPTTRRWLQQLLHNVGGNRVPGLQAGGGFDHMMVN
ncbi:hypothetical protein OIU79_026863 [Salix purpurea]|uniref:Uncharacterized protein n=1 Tax=Salix purpurea TaxID=77065 RepID=A0A9Q0VSD0_SALPP|nr:hypothetical protein OIU79_026863 [Salix purpurea]